MAGEIKGVILDDGVHKIDYQSLYNLPSIPTKVSDLTNDSGFITSAPTKVSDLTNDSGFISTETDPTVPNWAKQSQKPTYTAQEVGALPSSTQIPTKVSDLTNDSGFITGVSNATSSQVGLVKPDGTTITVDQDGTIHGSDGTSIMSVSATYTSNLSGGGGYYKVTTGDYTVSDGAMLVVTFKSASSSNAYAYLKINDGGQYSIYAENRALKTSDISNVLGIPLLITYVSGTGWVIVGSTAKSALTASDTTYGVVKIDNNSIRVNEQGQLYVDIRSTEGVEF